MWPHCLQLTNSCQAEVRSSSQGYFCQFSFVWTKLLLGNKSIWVHSMHEGGHCPSHQKRQMRQFPICDTYLLVFGRGCGGTWSLVESFQAGLSLADATNMSKVPFLAVWTVSDTQCGIRSWCTQPGDDPNVAAGVWKLYLGTRVVTATRAVQFITFLGEA